MTRLTSPRPSRGLGGAGWLCPQGQATCASRPYARSKFVLVSTWSLVGVVSQKSLKPAAYFTSILLCTPAKSRPLGLVVSEAGSGSSPMPGVAQAPVAEDNPPVPQVDGGNGVYQGASCSSETSGTTRARSELVVICTTSGCWYGIMYVT